MHQVGFGFFGRPIGLEYVSNGLFKELSIEEETYLNLPRRENLLMGERIVKLSRQIYNQMEIIKIYIYDFAISFNEREGGFIGSVYVFSGNPTKDLLYNAVKHLHPKIYSLVDKQHKFLSKDFPLKEQDLIASNTPGLITGSPRKINPPTDNRDYFVLTDGSLIEHLISAVQGFMYNPNFRNLEHLYVSDNQALLKRLSGNNQNNILGLGHLLNFQNHFQKLNKSLDGKRKEYNELNEKIKSKEAKAEEEFKLRISNLNNEIDGKKRELAELNQTLTNINEDLKAKNNKIASFDGELLGKQNEKEKLSKEITSLRRKTNELKNTNFKTFKGILNNPKIKHDFENYVNNHHPRVEELEKENQELKQEKERREADKATFKQKLVLFGIVLLLFLGLGYVGGSYIPFKKIKQKLGLSINHENVQNNVSVSNVEGIKEDPVKEERLLPKEYSLKEFFKLGTNEQREHKKKLDEFIEKLETGKEVSETDKDAFYKRKWNIGELIDVKDFDQNKVLGGLNRITEIKKIYEKEKQYLEKFDSKFGLMENVNEFEDETINFQTSKRNEILKRYLENPRNIYEGINLDKTKYAVGFDNEENIGELNNEMLVYMHFRWMVYKLSDDQIDLKTTNKTEFKVKLLSK